MDVVKLLATRGADVTCRDKRGYVPLHAAAASGQLDVVAYLLGLGLEVKWLLMINTVENLFYNDS